jgi:hypothetical protein
LAAKTDLIFDKKTGRDRVTPDNLTDPPLLGGRGVGLNLGLRLNLSRGASLTSAASPEIKYDHEDNEGDNDTCYHEFHPLTREG